MKKNEQFNQIMHFFATNDALSRLLPNLENLQRIEKVCRRIMPSVFLKSRVVAWENHQLTINVPTSAFASKFKQSVPVLITELQKSGIPVEKIRVKVRLKTTLEPTPREPRKPLSEKAKAEIAKLAQILKEQNENSELTKAVHELLENT